MPVKFDLGSKLGKICGGKIQNKIKILRSSFWRAGFVPMTYAVWFIKFNKTQEPLAKIGQI